MWKLIKSICYLWIEFLICGGNLLLGNTDEQKNISVNDDELERLYELYLQVQSGDRTAFCRLKQFI